MGSLRSCLSFALYCAPHLHACTRFLVSQSCFCSPIFFTYSITRLIQIISHLSTIALLKCFVTTLHYSTSALHYSTLHYSTSALHYSTLHYSTSALHYSTLHYSTSALHYSTSALHYSTLHYSTLHYSIQF